MDADTRITSASPPDSVTVMPLILAVSFSHLINDTIQALLPAAYPVLKGAHQLSFGELGLITLAFQVTASLLQPVVGMAMDRRPFPYALPLGMGLTLAGLVSLSNASNFVIILLSAVLIGGGSAIFHPEASRVAYMAAGRRRGFAQSLFQVGGNSGSALGPLLAALVVVPHGQRSIIAFGGLALVGGAVLTAVGRWQGRSFAWIRRPASSPALPVKRPRRIIAVAMTVLVILTFSKFVYVASLTDYYTFYLMERFGMPIQGAQLRLFLLLAAVAVGTFVGGPLGDRFGRKRVIWGSILGVAPFTLWLPHAGQATVGILSVIIGLVLASAFSAILVYAQELLPGRVGFVAGLFFALAFGIAGIGSAVLGQLADAYSITYIFRICSYLPLLGLLAVFLPDVAVDQAETGP